MLTQLSISNLAVVDEVTVDLLPGFSALTGETGAGKSILVDALALALGDRADSQAVRAGEDRTEVTAWFDLQHRPDLLEWLKNHDLDDGPECVVRRIVTSEGRSRGYINGRAVAMQSLRELGQQLVDICGQQAHQSLRHRSVQRKILDQHGDNDGLLTNMEAAFLHWQDLETERHQLQLARDDRVSRLDLLNYQVMELEALNLLDGEIEKLEKELLLLTNRSRIADGLTEALSRLYDDEQTSAQDTMTAAKRAIENLVEFDAHLETAVALLAEAEIQISETAEILRARLTDSEHDPNRQQHVENRLASIQELARKHKVAAADLPALQNQLAAELDDLSGSDQRLAELSAETALAHRQMLADAQALSRARIKAGKSLSDDVTGHLQHLGMPGAAFHISIEALDEDRIGVSGADQLDFMVATNPGQEPGMLTRIASGGELSRISLAIQVVAAGAASVPTLIFDEVDAGVGGAVAEVVGVCLNQLSSNRQVLCVTHLPQVASQADQQLRVSKMTDGTTTRTTVRPLTEDERIEEIARMLGGVEITDRTRAHAREMLAAAGAPVGEAASHE